jgi:hypothetical protein
MTTWDRIVWGAIAAFAGLLLACAIALVLMYQAQELHFNRALVLFSTVYFFAAGYWKGPLAADLFGSAAHGGSGYIQTEMDGGLSRREPPQTTPTERAVEYLGIGYLLGVIACLFLG